MKSALVLAAALWSCIACTGKQAICVLETPPQGGLPYLRRTAALAASVMPSSAKAACSEAERGPALECEAVDDLAALEGNGLACGPGGPEAQHVCPRYPKDVLKRSSSPRYTTRPCGSSACPNVELVFDSGDALSYVTFYDDPSCHGGPPEPVCAPARHACYYRVLYVQTALKGSLD